MNIVKSQNELFNHTLTENISKLNLNECIKKVGNQTLTSNSKLPHLNSNHQTLEDEAKALMDKQ